MSADRLAREFRPATPDDEPFIFSSWLNSHKTSGDWPHRIAGCCNYSHRRYFDVHKNVVMALVKNSKTIVACNPARPGQILGFITFDEGGPLHWVDVKKLYRRNGVAADLLVEAGVDRHPNGRAIPCSHWSIGAQNLRAAGFPLQYDPMILGSPPFIVKELRA